MLKLPVEVRKVRKDSYLCIMSEQEENKNLSGKPGISGPTSMSKTEIDDFEEALAMLRAVGVDAMVCNTPVAVSVSSVKCGFG